MTTDAPDRPIASLLRCWTPAARALLIALAIPLALRFAAGGLGRADARPEAWPDLAVDANAAPLPVLEALPGLGPGLARRIDSARRERPFASLDDLDRRVRGIGPNRAGALRPFLRFGPRRAAEPTQP